MKKNIKKFVVTAIALFFIWAIPTYALKFTSGLGWGKSSIVVTIVIISLLMVKYFDKTYDKFKK